MSLVRQQAAFLQDAAKLIQFAATIGIILTGGRLYSTDEEQLAYYKKKLSKTKSSRHCMRLAIDFNFFDLNLKPVVDKEVLLPLASYWKSLNPRNDCGLLWGWDFYHFERKPQTKGEAA